MFVLASTGFVRTNPAAHLHKQRNWIAKYPALLRQASRLLAQTQRLPRQLLVSEVSAAASVGASASGRGVHRTPAPLIPRRNGDIYGKRDITEIHDI